MGGLLLTDESGIPLDFRYVEPITPTKLQAVLYGKALESHLLQPPGQLGGGMVRGRRGLYEGDDVVDVGAIGDGHDVIEPPHPDMNPTRSRRKRARRARRSRLLR